MMMQLSPAQLSSQARAAIDLMVSTGVPATIQYEGKDGKVRRAYVRDERNREKPVAVEALDELVKAGIVTDRQDGLFAGIGQTYAPRLHAVLKIRLGGVRTDRATGARYRKAEVVTTGGVYTCEICCRSSKDADAVDGDGIKAKVYELIAEKRPAVGISAMAAE